MVHRVLSHTADTGIEATADSFPALLHELAAGMFELIAVLGPEAARRWITLRVESADPAELVVDTLSELVYHSEIEDLVFCDFRVEQEEHGKGVAVTVAAGGIPVAEVDPDGPPIKAVTYHDLVVEERDAGWYARVYFDV